MVADHRLLAVACVSTHTAREARKRHDLAPSSAALLGQSLSAGLLMSALQKDDQNVNIQVGCEGPAGGLLVDASPSGTARGYVRNTTVDFPVAERFETAPMLGHEGYLAVMRERGGEFYRGVVGLETGDLTLDLEHYYRQSEQTETTLQLESFSDGDEALGWVGGILVQCMPGGDVDELDRIRKRLRNGALADALRSGKRTVHAILEAVLEQPALELIADQDVSFHCPCSHERVVRALSTIAPTELATMIAEDGQAEAGCDFCGSQYLVTGDELRVIHAASTAQNEAAEKASPNESTP